MSKAEIEVMTERAKAMTEEEQQIFLAAVPSTLLWNELYKRESEARATIESMRHLLAEV